MENIKTKLTKTIRTQLDVPSTDPDERRRSRLLNIFLVGFFVLALLAVVGVSVVLLVVPTISQEGVLLGLWAGIAAAIFTSITWGINRYGSGKLARFLFILFLTIILVLSDVPEQVATGRSLVAFAIPIILTSVLFPSYTSFFAAGLVSVLITGVALHAQLVPDPFAIATFFMIALAAWLAARSMERAMYDLRILNEELDQRVQDRTRELAEALSRETATAVRNTTILESIADGVLFFDTNDRVVIANPTANKLAKQNLQLLTLRDILTTVEDKARDAIQTWMGGKKPADQSNVKFEWHERTISATLAPVILTNPNGAAVDAGKVMVLRDFTKEAELEKAKNLFLGTVSHELRTPMTAIQGFVSVLLEMEKNTISDKGYEHLLTIDVSIKQLLKLANELIDLSRMETGEIDLYCQWVDIGAIVKNAAKIIEQEFTSRNLSLTVNLAQHLPKLYVDRNRILQVLLNLLSNAYKYTGQGGATVEVTQSDEWVNISVIDTGIGIKEADKAKMFDRFFRASDRFVQKAGGTGLGLNISKGLAELHGGKLNFDSEYGVGTTFTVSLPKNGVIVQDN
jgi:signal transduction histidine kinase